MKDSEGVVIYPEVMYKEQRDRLINVMYTKCSNCEWISERDTRETVCFGCESRSRLHQYVVVYEENMSRSEFEDILSNQPNWYMNRLAKGYNESDLQDKLKLWALERFI